jgi:anti-sigma regulatory factor (Ser/Thr protein kinase)
MERELARITTRCDRFAPAFVRAALGQLPDLGWVLGDAMLVASELVSNAVRHSRCADGELLTVCLTRTGNQLRIAVRDPGRSARTATLSLRPDGDGDGGLGLVVVEQLTARWGAERCDAGYGVWAELQMQTESALL